MAALTDAQKATLKTDILANTDPVVVQARIDGANGVIASWYSGDASPDYWVWQSIRSLDQVGLSLDGVDIGNITSANAERVGVFFTAVPGGVVPSRADHRAFFDDVFSGAVGATTRANLDALWRRLANRLEKLFATGPGTGTNADPATLVVEGSATAANVQGWET